MSDLLIGKSNLKGKNSTYTSGKWFYLEDNKDNVFRVLPPLHSLARTGEFAKYYSVHRQIKGTDNKQRPFLCNQEKDYKSKMITRRCPLCDRAAELKSKLDSATVSGQMTKEEAFQFEQKNIWPLKPEKKYYLNVINQEGNIGVIAVSISMYQDLQNTLKDWDKKGFDLTGQKGAFLNFTVSKKYKGDKDAVHKVVPFTQVNKDGSFSLVSHEITPDIIERLRSESRDLSKLFKSLEDEDVALLASTDGLERSEIADRLFASQENSDQVEPETMTKHRKEASEGLSATRLEARIPGTAAKAVTNIDVSETGIKTNTPTDFLSLTGSPNTMPKNELPSVSQSQVKTKTTSSMSDEEFMAMFKSK
jgi:hypothetical protein